MRRPFSEELERELEAEREEKRRWREECGWVSQEATRKILDDMRGKVTLVGDSDPTLEVLEARKRVEDKRKKNGVQSKGITVEQFLSIGRWAEVLPEGEFGIWLRTANPCLEGRAPMDLIRKGKAQMVADLVERMISTKPVKED